MSTAATIHTDDLIGKPWRLGARGPDAYDCWGLVLVLADRFGCKVPPDWCSRDMTRRQQRELMGNESRARTERLAEPVDGAIAYSERAAHAGFVLAGRVLHAGRSSGVVAWPVGLWTQAYPDCGWYAWRG
jgi:cell wall-associated NlpC family hydrolase